MGLFGKKEACPVCGGEVKGLFPKKIGGKKALCKECSAQVSMAPELLKNATPEFVQEHLAYRRKNAERYHDLHWAAKYVARGVSMGVDPEAGCLYLVDSDMDDHENPVVFDFGQITHYELYRMKQKLDETESTEDVHLETNFSLLGTISRLANDKNRNEHFSIILKTTEPYWPELELRVNFDSPDDIHGFTGFGEDLKKMCRVLKNASRKEPVLLY